ncbi:MAG TPA: prepilin-type N-terminal cleavage/methylation domain-containing protein [Solirubrobacteraceae bacterium]
MSPLHIQSAPLRDEHGFTLIELLVSMVMMTVLTLAAFSFLQFTTEDVSHITARVGVDQTGRTALERIMLELHSACVTTPVIPIQGNSNENVIKFTSQSGNESAFLTVNEHVITYTPASGTTEGTLIEQTFPSTGSEKEGIYPFSTTASSTTKLLTGVRQTQYGSETATPIFQYYRYYKAGDTIPEGDATLPYGELNNTPMTGTVSAVEAEKITKVTMSFTLAPEGKESVSFNHDRPVALTDSAVLRLAPASETYDNLPCSEKT